MKQVNPILDTHITALQFIRVIISLLMITSVFSVIPVLSQNEIPTVYVREYPKYFKFHNGFDDYLVSKKGVQISNTMLKRWCEITFGIGFKYNNNNFFFWSKGLNMTWKPFNGSDFARIFGIIKLSQKVKFAVRYRLEETYPYLQITLFLRTNLSFPLEDIKFGYRFQNISIPEDSPDFCTFWFDNQSYKYFIPTNTFQHEPTNRSMSLNHLAFYDNETRKFVDIMFDWNCLINNNSYPVNVRVRGQNETVDLIIYGKRLPSNSITEYSFWFQDPKKTIFTDEDTYSSPDYHHELIESWEDPSIHRSTSKSDSGADVSCRYGMQFFKVNRSDYSDMTEIISNGHDFYVQRNSGSTGFFIVSKTKNINNISIGCDYYFACRCWCGVNHHTNGWIYDDHDYLHIFKEDVEQLDSHLLYIKMLTYRSYTVRGTNAEHYHPYNSDNEMLIDQIIDFEYTNISCVVGEWNTITIWNFQLLTKSWNNITTWNYQLLTKSWNIITAWNFQLLTKSWKTISIWIFQLTYGIEFYFLGLYILILLGSVLALIGIAYVRSR